MCTRTLHQIFLEHVPLHSSENRKELYYKTFSVCVMDLRKILKLFYANILSFPKKAITIDKKLWISAWKQVQKDKNSFCIVLVLHGRGKNACTHQEFYDSP